MFDPPELLRASFERVLARVRSRRGREHGMLIGGADRFCNEKQDDRSPISTDRLLGDAQEAAELIRDACGQTEANAGYVRPMGRDPLPGYRATNVSALRPHGATTGAWPGFQPFGGWKGSGSSGKHGGGLYCLPLYMREQVRTLVEKRRGEPRV